MKFDKNSMLVKSWVNLILMDVYTKEDVPNLSNLREVVIPIVDSMA